MDSLIPSTLKIDKTALSLVPCFDTSDEKLYWLSRTPTERLQHIEVLRRINYGHHIPPDFKEFLRLLNTHGVEYLLIGGYGVGYHGYPRATNDMDIWIAMHPQNAERTVTVLRAFGFDTPDLSPEKSTSKPVVGIKTWTT